MDWHPPISSPLFQSMKTSNFRVFFFVTLPAAFLRRPSQLGDRVRTIVKGRILHLTLITISESYEQGVNGILLFDPVIYRTSTAV